jgi:hypothetical protein
LATAKKIGKEDAAFVLYPTIPVSHVSSSFDYAVFETITPEMQKRDGVSHSLRQQCGTKYEKRETLMKHRLRKVFLVAFCHLVVLVNCKPKLVSQAGVENYGVAKWGVDTSYLKQIVANNGRVDLCIDRQGEPGEDLYLNTVPNAAQKAIKEWTRVLYGYRDWPFREVAVNWVNASSQQCPANKKIIRIHVLERGVWDGSKNIVKNTFCAQFQTAPVCADIVRSYAHWFDREIFLIAGRPSDFDRIILHELGHIFGLADVYHERGYSDYAPINPVASVMENATHVAIDGDDAQGLRWVWDAIQGRRDFENPSCGTGYRDSGAYKQAGILYCVPTNVPKSRTTNSQSFNSNPN